MTHSPWTISTLPNTHSFCGDLAYEATYNGLPVDDLTMPRYYATNRTFALYSDDVTVVGQFVLVTISASLVDYPLIVNDPLVPQSIAIEIIAPCDNPPQILTPAQLNPPIYRYSADLPSMFFYLSPF